MVHPGHLSKLPSSLASATTAGSLSRLKYSDKTRQVYMQAVERFFIWAGFGGLVTDLEESVESLDRLVSTYLNHIFNMNRFKSPQEAVNLRYGLTMYYPQLRRCMWLTDADIKGWQKTYSSVSRSWPPLTWPVTVIIAAILAERGSLAAATATLLAFDCYLRVNEVLSIRREDISLPGDMRENKSRSTGLLRLPVTKTGKEQFVTIRDPDVLRLLRVIRSQTPAKERLFPYSAQSFRSWFHYICKDLGLEDCGFVLHSLRHGGATKDYEEGLPVEDIMLRGRWVSNGACRRYLQSGRARLLSYKVPEYITELASSHSAKVYDFIINTFATRNAQ